jgi:hypothetical protein
MCDAMPRSQSSRIADQLDGHGPSNLLRRRQTACSKWLTHARFNHGVSIADGLDTCRPRPIETTSLERGCRHILWVGQRTRGIDGTRGNMVEEEELPESRWGWSAGWGWTEPNGNAPATTWGWASPVHSGKSLTRLLER